MVIAVGIEHVRHRAPADVSGQLGFLIVGSFAFLCLDCLQRADRRYVVTRLFQRDRLAPMRWVVCDAEIAGRLDLGFFFEDNSLAVRNWCEAISQAW